MADIPPSTFRRDPDFGRNRVEPRRYGVGRYGVGRYSPSDPTRFAWARVKPAAIAFLLALFIAAPAAADTLTPGLNLIKISEDVEDPLRTWGSKEDENKDILDAAICDKRTGCTITGQLIVQTTIQAAAIIAESSVSVQAPLTGDGLVGTPIGVDSSSVTLLGPTIDAAELPADGYASTYVNVTGDTVTGDLIIANLRIQGAKTLAQIRLLVCPEGDGRCLVVATDEKSTVYKSSGALAGQYVNNRGVGP